MGEEGLHWVLKACSELLHLDAVVQIPGIAESKNAHRKLDWLPVRRAGADTCASRYSNRISALWLEVSKISRPIPFAPPPPFFLILHSVRVGGPSAERLEGIMDVRHFPAAHNKIPPPRILRSWSEKKTIFRFVETCHSHGSILNNNRHEAYLVRVCPILHELSCRCWLYVPGQGDWGGGWKLSHLQVVENEKMKRTAKLGVKCADGGFQDEAFSGLRRAWILGSVQIRISVTSAFNWSSTFARHRMHVYFEGRKLGRSGSNQWLRYTLITRISEFHAGLGC